MDTSTVSPSRATANAARSRPQSHVRSAWTQTDRLIALATAWTLFAVGLLYILTTTAGFVIAGGAPGSNCGSGLRRHGAAHPR
jgi:hypothetical protein